ncbi:YigZ family protein [Limosilactobacillus pontis]|uniref:Yigz family protein n=1 Tax=Limosilactobacillus pontis DSM 8475 TaxID=1423794 RepID=A0A922PUI1_9LACO|nr:YigZ family protein [Limosilactobacillus pontis]KRM35998.1 yigz family protein [Limosilactobacillus pontis DSM 8475]QFV00577.1 YigZ family protein [Limosilactobacillus pontis]
MSEPFITIAQNTSFTMVIKKSRFICSLGRAENEADAQAFIDEVQAANRKATHNCFAYMIGDHDQVQRESDNGEPSGTAGVPILESLQLAKLHNVVAVVTRYFGGIKLGAGGLIRAYSNVTTNAIRQAGLVQRVVQTGVDITVSYAQHDQLLYFLKEQQVAVVNDAYGVDVTVTVFVNQEACDDLIAQLTTRFNDQLQIKKGQPRNHEVPYQPA